MIDRRMMILRTLTRADNDPKIPGRVEATCDWVRANNLDPREVAACVDEVILTVEEIDGQQMIRYRKFVRGENGRVQIGDDDKVMTVEQLVPLLVPMPDRWEA